MVYTTIDPTFLSNAHWAGYLDTISDWVWQIWESIDDIYHTHKFPLKIVRPDGEALSSKHKENILTYNYCPDLAT